MPASKLADAPADLAGLAEYQDGAVVSQTITKGPSGTVTVFAFDRGEGLSEHTAPFDALVYLLDGRAVVTIAGTPHPVTAGQILRLPAGEPHALHAEERFKMLLVMIRG